MKDIVLPLKAVYFDQIKAGTKVEEYRLVTPYWTKRFSRQYRNVILTRGYPRRDDAARRMTFPWLGVTVRQIQHPHFGAEHVSVYVIDLKPRPAQPRAVKAVSCSRLTVYPKGN